MSMFKAGDILVIRGLPKRWYVRLWRWLRRLGRAEKPVAWTVVGVTGTSYELRSPHGEESKLTTTW